MTDPTVSLARAWTPSVLREQGARWRSCAGLVDAEVDGYRRAVRGARDVWGGVAADAAWARAGEIAAIADSAVAALREAADAANSAAAQLDAARDVILDAVAAAQAEGFAVPEDGAVAVPAELFLAAPGSGVDAALVTAVAERRARQHRAVIQGALGDLAAADDRATPLITAAFARLPRAGDPGTGWLGVQRFVPPPPDGAGAAANRAWWDALTAGQQQTLVETAPASVGNLDGLPAAVRHRVNTDRLPAERAALEAEHREQWGRVTSLGSVESLFARKRIAEADRRLADLDAVQVAIEQHPDRMLLLLEVRAGEQVRAAVAVGDPDTADHIAVSTPGLNSAVRSTLGPMVDEAVALRREAQIQLRAAPGREHETVATIVWVGYDAPQMSGSVVDRVEGGLAVALEDRARAGASDLARFYDGLGAAHTGSDPHVTAVGHSYGSVTTGLALHGPGRHAVDDLVVYGSPGLVGVRSPSDLGLAPGRAYEMTADGDVIARLNRFGPGPFGGGPHATDGFTHLATEAGTTPDGVARDGASGHSEYPRPGADGHLRTSGYNLAAIVAGLPERAVTVAGGADSGHRGFDPARTG
ncbi:alpha/beta hydrolase [Prescottella defluvii]|uniref:alpha/beta hydrolase n=1 Tax=Prescottella defluvii TaxID=1323361 RepID=UPI0012E04A2B|nr:alpha/beta hydrolase [Prescottella defluvii]